LAPEAVQRVGRRLAEWGNPFQEEAPASVNGSGTVALFVGDMAHHRWPSAVVAAQRLLQAAGLEPVTIGVGRNNGYLASSLGYPDLARQLARATLAELKASGAETMLVLSPGDYFAFHQLIDERLGLVWPEEVELVELTGFLANTINTGRLAFREADEASFEKVHLPHAYVDPTHAVRVPARHDAPRALLGAVMPEDSIELFWRRERAHPSGDGALVFASPHIADHLTYARLGDLVQSGVRLAITEDPGSLSRLSQHAARFGVEVQGLYELLADHVQ
jgi:Fe-S oxidoreductase